jgi:glycine betaine/choline ABC-type transport system substrate-binding protein
MLVPVLARLRAIAGLFLFVAATAALLALVFFLIDLRDAQTATPGVIRIGSKADTEGIVLAEILAQVIEHETKLQVERRTNLGGTHLCFEALRAGEIDLYPEYTGTGLVGILEKPAVLDASRALEIVRRDFAARYSMVWLDPFAFNNTYALAMTRARASALGIRALTDLTRHAELRAGFTAEFLARKDGYPGLESRGVRFAVQPRSMEAGLMYAAVADGAVDLISAYATDGRIDKLGLVTLEDDLGFFPPYQAAPLVRAQTLAREPRLRAALQLIAGRIGDAEMRRLNAAVDLEREPAASVASAWIRSAFHWKSTR